MNRRAALKLMLAAGASAGALVAGRRSESAMETNRMPAIFLAHGAPMLVDDALWTSELKRWAAALPAPSAILMLSAHWTEQPVTLGATRPVPLIYDFYGFPERYYRLTYPAPGAPELASRVRALLEPLGPVAHEPERGLDHGAYIPLLVMYPEAKIPVLQVSLPSMEPREMLALGQALAPLRGEGVLITGSGHLTHNLRRADFGDRPSTPSWASDFDAWAADALARKDVDALLDYRAKAPGVQLSLPTHEHFVPVLAALGAAIDGPTSVSFPITGWIGGSLTKRSVQFT